ncbi:MAG TPA: Gfo/Idh/MocA family oxidoreductase [Firmicutes bacterium]|nr:Gfo/Idh/MocA family oxidoreductase [Bacillota bacterium]
MKQVVQNYRSGILRVEEVPAPAIRPGTVLVRTRASVISSGTERLMVSLARMSLLGKARTRPDLVKQVMDKLRTEGFKETWLQATSRLDTPVPLGYTCAGDVIEVGPGVQGVTVGQAVACLGSGYASHAEVVRVPVNLICPVPPGVSYEHAAFVGLGAIALHGVRNARVQLGDRVGVIGLGLLGLLAVQLLKASGARVFGLDVAPGRAALAERLGADRVTSSAGYEAVQEAMAFTDGVGLDAVLIFASTRSSAPVALAGDMARARARIVAVGAVGLDIPRELYYHKELSVIVSRSWGPGIEDPRYERKGVDYPIEYVRWTQQRNMQAFLELVASGKVVLDPLITHRFTIDDAEQAYELITGKKPEPHIAIVLTYPEREAGARRVELQSPPARQLSHSSLRSEPIGVGLIGAGLFAKGTLLPILRRGHRIRLTGVVTTSGVTARHAAERYGFRFCATEMNELLDDPDTHAVIIATRHGDHADLVCRALAAGKHVFVEKPLAINEEQLRVVMEAARQSDRTLMVGFNRRYSPFTRAAKKWLGRESGPLSLVIRVNAGQVPPTSWVVDADEGAGRIIGEVCHFVDLAQYLTGGLVREVAASGMDGYRKAGEDGSRNDTTHITLLMEDGSIATIVYSALGHKAFPRERVEAFRGHGVCVIDNFRGATFTSPTWSTRRRGWNIDRGHAAELQAFFAAVRGDPSGLPTLEEYENTTLTTLAIERALGKKAWVTVGPRDDRPGNGAQVGMSSTVTGTGTVEGA